MWPVREVLHDDELLSTWLARSAWHMQVPISALLAEGVRDQRKGGRSADLDVCIGGDLARHLSEQSGIPIQRLRCASLLRYDGCTFEIPPQPADIPWVLASALQPVSGRIGYAICSRCLATDVTPYFRTHWRLGTTYICEKHGTFLHDCCLECGAFIYPWRDRKIAVEPHQYCICHRCAADLTRQSDVAIPAECSPMGLLIFSQITQQLEQGTIRLPASGTEQYLILLLRGIRCLVHSLAMLREEYSLVRALNRACDYQFGFESWNTSRLEGKPLEPRCIACCGVAALLEDWPRNFVNVCRKAKLRAHHFQLTEKRSLGLPFWLQQVIDFELEHAKPQAWRARPDMLAVSGRAAGQLVVDFFASLDQHFSQAASISERWSLARDRTVILAICMGAASLEDVRHWSHRPPYESLSGEYVLESSNLMPPRFTQDLSRCFFMEHLNWFTAFDVHTRPVSSTVDRWLFRSRFKKDPDIVSVPVSQGTVRRRAAVIQAELGWPATLDSLETLRELFRMGRAESRSA